MQIGKRIGGIRMSDVSRAEFSDSASARDFRKLTKQPQLRVLQCSAPISDSVWKLVNEHFCTARPDVLIRVYGHYSSECDLAFTRLLTNVRRFAANDLMSARNIETIAEMSNLESLSLGIYDLQDFGVLERVSPGLTSIYLGETRSKKPSLAPLSRFGSLRSLTLAGQAKDIEVLDAVRTLEAISLWSITTPDLNYLARLSKLWSLVITLGGIRELAGIVGNENIKHLEVRQVRKFPDIDFLTTLPGLQNLALQSLPHVKSFPRLNDSTSLRRIALANLKGLCDFKALKSAPSLEEFYLTDGSKQNPQQLIPVLSNPRVKRVNAYFGSDRKNTEFLKLREKHGKAEMKRNEPFEYC